MGTRFWKVVCDEYGIRGGEYYGDNDAQFGRINLLNHEVQSGNCVSRAVIFEFEPGVIGAVYCARVAARRTQSPTQGHVPQFVSCVGLVM
jgi:hypothetical protein